MDEYQPSEKVRAILTAAASSPELLDMLVKHREKALARMGLSAEEKAALTSLSDERLVKMVRKDRAEKGLWRALRSRVLLFAVIAVALAVFASVTEDKAAKRAKAALIQLSTAEDVYKLEHGVYADMDSLLRSGVVKNESLKAELRDGAGYEYEIEIDGGTFTATARPRTRLDSRPAFRVGPDGRVKGLE